MDKKDENDGKQWYVSPPIYGVSSVLFFLGNSQEKPTGYRTHMGRRKPVAWSNTELYKLTSSCTL